MGERRARRLKELAPATASADLPKKPPRSFLSNLLFWGTVSILAVVILLSSVGAWALGAYDDGHRDRIECTVTGAVADDGNPMGRRSWSTPAVEISTSDCGALVFTGGSGKDAENAIAEELAQGGRFSFEMGQATRSLSGFFDAAGISWRPEVLSYQKID